MLGRASFVHGVTAQEVFGQGLTHSCQRELSEPILLREACLGVCAGNQIPLAVARSGDHHQVACRGERLAA